jgi:hypothetical protein
LPLNPRVRVAFAGMTGEEIRDSNLR